MKESLGPTAVYWNNGKTVDAFSKRSFECTLQALRHFDTTPSHHLWGESPSLTVQPFL